MFSVFMGYISTPACTQQYYSESYLMTKISSAIFICRVVKKCLSVMLNLTPTFMDMNFYRHYRFFTFIIIQAQNVS